MIVSRQASATTLLRIERKPHCIERCQKWRSEGFKCRVGATIAGYCHDHQPYVLREEAFLSLHYLACSSTSPILAAFELGKQACHPCIRYATSAELRDHRSATILMSPLCLALYDSLQTRFKVPCTHCSKTHQCLHMTRT